MVESRLTILASWFENHSEILAWLGLFSVGIFIVSLIVIPLLIVNLPKDYLTACSRPRIIAPRWRGLYLVSKNLAGILILIAGLAMLVLPGQGLLTLVVALTLLDFPGKRRFIRRVMKQPKVLKTINRLRKKAGKPPLSVDDADTDPLYCSPVDHS